MGENTDFWWFWYLDVVHECARSSITMLCKDMRQLANAHQPENGIRHAVKDCVREIFQQGGINARKYERGGNGVLRNHPCGEWLSQRLFAEVR